RELFVPVRLLFLAATTSRRCNISTLASRSVQTVPLTVPLSASRAIAYVNSHNDPVACVGYSLSASQLYWISRNVRREVKLGRRGLLLRGATRNIRPLPRRG